MYRKIAFTLTVFAALTLIAMPLSAMKLLEKYENLKAGQWVTFKSAKHTRHTLLVAHRDGDLITLEEKITERGMITSWTQLVIDVKKKKATLFRERDPIANLITQRKATDDDQEIDEILRLNFRPEGNDRVRVPAGKFDCEVLSAILDGDLIRIWFAKEITLYPVKIALYKYSKEIKLTDHGDSKQSEFFKTEDGEIELKEKPPVE